MDILIIRESAAERLLLSGIINTAWVYRLTSIKFRTDEQFRNIPRRQDLLYGFNPYRTFQSN